MLTLTTKSIIAATGLVNSTVSTKFAGLAIRRDGTRVIYDAVDIIPTLTTPRLRRAVPDLLALAVEEGDSLYCGAAAESVRRGKALYGWMEPAMRERLAALRVRFAEGLGRGAPSGSLRDYLPLLGHQLTCHPSIYLAAILDDRKSLPNDWADWAMAFSAVNASHIYQEV